MAPVDSIVGSALAWLDEGKACALATVIDTWGSSPRPVGSQLLVDAHGNFTGSVSGGCVESAVVAEARQVIGDGSGRLLEFGVSDSEAWGVGLACGGTIRVLVTPCPSGSDFEAVAEAGRRQQTVLMLTSLADYTHRVVAAPEECPGALHEACARALRTDRSRLVERPDRVVFVKVFSLPLRLLVVGAVHIGQALLPMARAAGYEVVIVDPRRAFASAERFPDAAVTHEWPDVALKRLQPDHRTAVVTLSHDSKLDEPALRCALASNAFYVGALGSRRTHAARCRRLRAIGLSEAQIARVHGPIGLAIGAATPAEIAVSIIAEMTAELRAGQRDSLTT